MSLLDINNLSISFSQYQGLFSKTSFSPVYDLSFNVNAGEMVAIIGASGSGKSLLAHTIMGILPKNATVDGSIIFEGEELTPTRMEKLRGSKIVLVPQSVEYLDPLMKVGKQIKKGRKDKATAGNLSNILHNYHLDDDVLDLYPYSLSGGMSRRILIASAMIENPSLVIADEPTPGIHHDVAVMVMKHFRELAQNGAGVVVITHDLELAVKTCDRIVVLYAGTNIENANASDFDTVENLRHPYTQALFNAMPKNGFHFIDGTQPYSVDYQKRCVFFDRCTNSSDECLKKIPLQNINNGYVKCIHSKQVSKNET